MHVVFVSRELEDSSPTLFQKKEKDGNEDPEGYRSEPDRAYDHRPEHLLTPPFPKPGRGWGTHVHVRSGPTGWATPPPALILYWKRLGMSLAS